MRSRITTLDDKSDCSQCKHCKQHKPEFLSAHTPAVPVCTHPSALRLNQGAVWSVTLARPICRGKRFERRLGKGAGATGSSS
jgi:hypothetical protein